MMKKDVYWLDEGDEIFIFMFYSYSFKIRERKTKQESTRYTNLVELEGKAAERCR